MKDIEALRRIKADCSEPKSRLISLLRQTEEAGFTKEAEQLGRIIARLEAWQNKI